MNILYGMSGRQNIYGTWLANTNIDYHKHTQPYNSIIFCYHIPISQNSTSRFHIILLTFHTQLNIKQHWQLFKKLFGTNTCLFHACLLYLFRNTDVYKYFFCMIWYLFKCHFSMSNLYTITYNLTAETSKVF